MSPQPTNDPENKQRVVLHKAVVELFRVFGLGRPALILCYTLPPGYLDVQKKVGKKKRV